MPPTTAPAQTAPARVVGPGFDWQRFKGETIRFIWTENDPTIAGVLPYWGEFAQLTGMKLQYEGLPTAQQRQKLAIALVAKEPTLDGWGMQVSQQGRQFWENGRIEPLDKYIADKELTDPAWDLDDFGEGARTAQQIPSPGATPNAVTLLTAQCQVFYYRTDLFQGAGLNPPSTVQEMEEAARALHKPDKQQFGITLRGAGKWVTTQIGTYLYGFGGKWIGDDGRLAIDTPEMVKTLDFYGGLLRKYGPPGASNIGDRENPAILQQGQAAMMTELNHWKVILNDPDKSPKVAGKIATTLIPRGPVAAPRQVANSSCCLFRTRRSRPSAGTRRPHGTSSSG
jgi:multiple sugar transport system substrate-binding protein